MIKARHQHLSASQFFYQLESQHLPRNQRSGTLRGKLIEVAQYGKFCLPSFHTQIPMKQVPISELPGKVFLSIVSISEFIFSFEPITQWIVGEHSLVPRTMIFAQGGEQDLRAKIQDTCSHFVLCEAQLSTHYTLIAIIEWKLVHQGNLYSRTQCQLQTRVRMLQ